MEIKEFISKYPDNKDDITAINKVFDTLGMQVNDVIVNAQVIRYRLTLPSDLNLLGKIRRKEKDIQFALTSILKTGEINYGYLEDYVYVDKKKPEFKPFNAIDLVAEMPCNNGSVPLLLGVDIDGHPLYTDLRKAPHILVAGTTGSGKSELLHTFIASLIRKRDITHTHIVIIDPKRAEFSYYKNKNDVDLITDMSLAVDKLKQCVDLMERRWVMLENAHVKDISQLPYEEHPIVVIIDELADLLDTNKNAEEYIVRLAQKARACGIHLILGTQTPRADVITGRIRANVPTRIALSTVNAIESRLIINEKGAEKLFGKGDMLYLGNGKLSLLHIQAAYLDEKGKQAVADWFPDKEEEPVKSEPAPTYDSPKHKRVGFIEGMVNLFKVKPVIFRTDDYPPRI